MFEVYVLLTASATKLYEFTCQLLQNTRKEEKKIFLIESKIHTNRTYVRVIVDAIVRCKHA